MLLLYYQSFRLDSSIDYALLGQAPICKIFTPKPKKNKASTTQLKQKPLSHSRFPHFWAHLNLARLKYVSPSSPQTGLYSGVVKQASSQGERVVPIPGIATVEVGGLRVEETCLPDPEKSLLPSLSPWSNTKRSLLLSRSSTTGRMSFWLGKRLLLLLFPAPQVNPRLFPNWRLLLFPVWPKPWDSSSGKANTCLLCLVGLR